jgi:dienelactone hydrolase
MPARLFALALFAAATPALAAPQAVTLTTADHVKVFASYYGTGDKGKPILLLFHQAGGSGAEYAEIAPKLNALGFNALALDQRSGGDLFGRPNRTVKALGHSTGYRAALPDLQAALDWARANDTGKIVVCGSSYSAALVFLLAANNPGKIAALMAFSPGEYLGSRHAVHDAAEKLKGVAVFVSSASNRGEIAAARAIVNAVPTKDKTQLVPKHAPHGASALNAEANPNGYKQVWAAVERFLAPLR